MCSQRDVPTGAIEGWEEGFPMGRSLNRLKSLAQATGRRKSTFLALAVLLSFLPTLVGGSASAQAATKADLAITVSDNPDPVFTNQSLTYVLAGVNLGPSPATGVEVTTALPSSVRFEPALSDPACTESGGIVTCGFSVWGANTARNFFITVTPSTAGVLQLTFSVTATERDPDRSNNSQTETTVVVEPTEADVSVNLPSSVEGYARQNIWLGSIEVRNAGPATATGVTVTLEFPPGLRPSYGGGQCTETTTGLSCSYPWGSIPPGRGSFGIIGVTAADAGSYTVHGSVIADQPDPMTSDNSDTTVVTANPAADLSTQIAESADPASPGKVLTYTVTVTNHGPSPATAVALTEAWSTLVRGGVQLLSFGSSQGQCVLAADQRVDCQLSGLASGANATLTVTLRPQGTGSITDQAQVSATEFDPDTANNADSETTTIGSA
jgi:uncharacterized repeat protein (TIGR01451 family)